MSAWQVGTREVKDILPIEKMRSLGVDLVAALKKRESWSINGTLDNAVGKFCLRFGRIRTRKCCLDSRGTKGLVVDSTPGRAVFGTGRRHGERRLAFTCQLHDPFEVRLGRNWQELFSRYHLFLLIWPS